jgi:hypothetical protein
MKTLPVKHASQRNKPCSVPLSYSAYSRIRKWLAEAGEIGKEVGSSCLMGIEIQFEKSSEDKKWDGCINGAWVTELYPSSG